jgi:hypothetical protein
MATEQLYGQEQAEVGLCGQIPEPWPCEVRMILSALEAAVPEDERRKHDRMPYRVAALLYLFSDGDGAGPWPLFIRDASTRGLGFVSNRRLPLGYGGVVELVSPDGDCVSVHCTLFRCRQAAPGWYEGSLYFNRAQSAFGTEVADAIAASEADH